MNKMKKILLSTLIPLITGVSANAAELNPKNPDDYKHFRMDYAEMVEIANPTRLRHRVFYTKPSEGPDAKWFDAVKQGDIETIKTMVDNGQNIEVKDEASLGQTALGWAAFIGYEDIVDYLVSKNANLMATDRADVTNALKSAGLGKNVAVFKKLRELLKDKVDLDNQSNDIQGETILIVASSNDRQEIVKYLLEEGAKTDLVTTEKDTSHPAYDQDALTFACRNGNAGTIKILMEHGAINHRINKPYCDY
ncbi:ankyrin repeat domain-containing protein [Bartonella sp. HY329]|uniref:ankyrin repeat domain-containing protein n=1 Tax=unclassified Bartonella TaxID=2645622 RepID=UPI0021C6F67D|nr:MULTISPECIES: ankyrin repeat domain-containing protein [unclassified Bartonella]UXM94769.1 ankyrin repeat domain-containing protein [Bartonella sp. HY329]UXN09092.1 ankyrin repeat domain-containing protein [Bartonella sp. HY328]